ncbi:MAG TPA: hypothetical protein VMB66_05295 [Candidatus Acidoferrales bacterium]|nr:hypothetical protein [Candidatus Acidoferrales bacterium]
MKFASSIRYSMALLLAASLAAFAASHGDKKEKAKPATSQTIDAGSFGVFVKGQRVATETFSIAQKEGLSEIKSQFKQTEGSDPVSQKSELEITSTGDLLHYDWSQSSGGSLSVVPSNDFLTEKVTPPNSSKAAEKAFLMPSTSSILDNNFFIQREVLVWRYLAADCKPEGGNLKCQQGPASFGALIPQDQTSASIRIELKGKEKVTIHNVERDLLRLDLTGESFDWALWVDDQDHFKLIQISIPADNTEVVRD